MSMRDLAEHLRPRAALVIAQSLALPQRSCRAAPAPARAVAGVLA